MRKAIKKQSWRDLPERSNMRELSDLYKVGARCDAWRDFLKSETVKKLNRLRGNVIWFNKWEHFDRLICEFQCSETTLRGAIDSLMMAGRKVPISFVRDDIYDARAWARIPLYCFTEADGFNERSGKNIWQYEVLERNEIPLVQFGLRLPWTVARDCFSMSHRIKDDGRFAEMTFSHSQLDERFKNRRWVADGMFKREATRKEMEENLFGRVKEECKKHLVTITEAT